MMHSSYEHTETRAKRYLKLGLINAVLEKNDLTPDSLENFILNNLLVIPTGALPNLDGANYCAQHIRDTLYY